MKQRGSGKQKWIAKGEEPPTAPDVYDKFAMLRVYKVAIEDKDKADYGYRTQERPGEEGASSRKVDRKELKKSKTGSSDQLDMTAQSSEAEMWANFANMNPFLQAYLGRTAFGMQGMLLPGGTTVMLRNIPYKYTRDLLVEQLNKGYAKQYDFVYLPIDFTNTNKSNVGYAFINFRLPATASQFIAEYHQAKTKDKLPGHASNKVCEVSYARVQGRDANMENLRDERFIEKLQDTPESQPLFFDENSEEMPFSKTLGTSSGRKKKGKGGATPSTPMSPAGFMMSPMFNPMMYAAGAFGQVPSAPPSVTLSSVLPASTAETMLRFKGLPTSFSRDQILEKLLADFKGDFDFLFVPVNNKENSNRGFCFVNFRTVEKAKAFTEKYNEKSAKEVFSLEDDASEACVVDQGRRVNIEKSVEKAQLHNKDDKEAWLPLLFDEDGKEQPCPKIGQAASAEAAPESGKGAKGKGKGKGGKNNPMPGFPGFNVPAGSSPQQAAALAQMAAFKSAAMFQQAQAQHFWAAAAASAHAGQGFDMPPSPSGKSPKSRGKGKGKGKEALPERKDGEPLSEEAKTAIRKQIEFYFSTDNLIKDMFLRANMDADGYTSLELISSFNRVSVYKATVDELAEIMAGSSILESDLVQKRIRLKDAELRAKWAKASTGDAAAPQAAAS